MSHDTGPAQLPIPRIIHTVWVGPKPAPMEWIETWKKMNPEWEHMLWNNRQVFDRKLWRNQKLIDEFRSRQNWRGIADTVRYEILYNEGGANFGADSICLRPIDDLFIGEQNDAFTCFENEKQRPELVSPLLACSQANPMARACIELLGLKEVDHTRDAWETTGNLFMKNVIGAMQYPRLRIWPSHYLLPEHYTGEKYAGAFMPFATHKWGSTLQLYK